MTVTPYLYTQKRTFNKTIFELLEDSEKKEVFRVTSLSPNDIVEEIEKDIEKFQNLKISKFNNIIVGKQFSHQKQCEILTLPVNQNVVFNVLKTISNINEAEPVS